MKLNLKYLVLSLLVSLSVSLSVSAESITALSFDKKVTIFIAKKIITMETSLPEASAVAVSDGKIVAVGSVEMLTELMKGREVAIDETFKDKIMMPGFIDPHVHPSLPAVLTQFPFLAPEDWDLPTGFFPAALTKAEYMESLKKLVTKHYKSPSVNKKQPFITWGYHQLWHGDIKRKDLDSLFPDSPVIIWHRSFHEVILNTAALELLGITYDGVKDNHEIDWEKGHFWEVGAQYVLANKGMHFIFSPDNYGQGMNNFVEMMHRGGITSAMDMGVGIFGDAEGEIALIHNAMNKKSTPARLVLTPIITYFLAAGDTPEQALTKINAWKAASTDKVIFDDHFKLMIDGAIFSGLSQYNFPGYLDGHEGVWLAPLKTTYQWAEFFWNEGYQLHAHVNGDKSTDALIDFVNKLYESKSRVDHRLVLEHFAFATDDQLKKLSELGVLISANPYYQYILSDVYAEKWLGEDRARNMVPLGSAKRENIRFALHSDAPMAPLSPLTLIWAAVNRETINGNKNFASQKINVHDALKAVTIDAAWMMRREDSIGSIRAGKNADFVILEKDPYRVSPSVIKDIPVWGTVFEGKTYPVETH